MLGITPGVALIQGVFTASGKSRIGGAVWALPAYLMRLFAHKELACERELRFTASLASDLILGKAAQIAAKALFLEEEFKALAYQVDVSVAALRLMGEMERFSQSINNIFHVVMYGSSFDRVADKMLGATSPSLLSPQNLQSLKHHTWRLLLALGNLHLAGEGQRAQFFLFRNLYYIRHLFSLQNSKLEAFTKEIGGQDISQLNASLCKIQNLQAPKKPETNGSWTSWIGGGSSAPAIKGQEPVAIGWK